MTRPLPDGGGFVDDADPSQPHIASAIDGGGELTAAEYVVRDHMVAPFLGEAILAIRNFSTGRAQLSPAKHPVDAAKHAATIAEMEATTK